MYRIFSNFFINYIDVAEVFFWKVKSCSNMNNLKTCALFFVLIICAFRSTAQLGANNSDCMPNFEIQQVYKEYAKAGKPLIDIEFDKQLNPLWVQRDLAIMKRVLEEANTSLYRYVTKEKVDNIFNMKMCGLKDSVSYLEFVRDVSEIFQTIACGHSGWSHTSSYKKYRNSKMKFFPLKIFSFEDQYFVRQNGSDNKKLLVGDRILKINGQSPKQINRVLRRHMVRDGTSGLNGTTGISRYFHMAYSNFVSNPDIFKLIVKDKLSGKRRTVLLPALYLNVIDSNIISRYAPEKGLGKPLRLTVFPDKRSATYTIKWFRNEYMKSQGQNFKGFTDSVFQVIRNKNIKNLIIDLRGNRGGWTANGSELFSYFINKPTRYINRLELNKTDSFSFSNILLKDQGIYDSMLFKKNKNGLLEWSNYHVQIARPKEKDSFKGNTYILIDDMSLSCSAVFSALMRSHTNAIFIGEETGGAQCGQNGMLIVVRLPYTGMVLRISTGKYTCNVKDVSNSRGVIPDYEVKTTWSDFVNKLDPQMDFVNDLINE